MTELNALSPKFIEELSSRATPVDLFSGQSAPAKIAYEGLLLLFSAFCLNVSPRIDIQSRHRDYLAAFIAG
jgi:hypothetical protein